LLGPYGGDEGVVAAVVSLLYQFNYRIQAEDGTLVQPHTAAGEKRYLVEEVQNVSFRKMDCDVTSQVRPVTEDPLRPGTGRDSLAGRGSRYCANRAIFHSGLVARFSEGNLCDLANQYLAEAKRLSGRKIAGCLRTAQVLHRYLAFLRKVHSGGQELPRDLSTDWRLVVSVDHVEDFVLALQSCMRPLTVRNQAQEILRFLKDGGAYGGLIRSLPRGLRAARVTAVDRWTLTFSRLQKLGHKFSRVRVLKGDLEPLSFFLLQSYLSDPRVLSSLDDAFQKLELRMNSAYSKDSFGYGNVPFLEYVQTLNNDWLFVVRFLVCSVLVQAQRLCVHLNLKLVEFEAARSYGALTVVRVEDHKTSSFYGAAAIVLDSRRRELWNRYWTLRVRFGNPFGPFLVNACGSKLSSNCLEHLNHYLVNNGRRPVSHTHVRRHVETASTLYACGAAGETPAVFLQAIQNFLCHSGAVVTAHYRFRTDEVICDQYRTLMYVVDQSVGLEVALRYKDRVLPESPLGRDFPSAAELLARLNALSLSFLQMNDVSHYLYKQVQRKWLEVTYARLLQALDKEMRQKIPDGITSSGSELQAYVVAQAAEATVEMIGSVWDCHKADIRLHLVRTYREGQVSTVLRA
jgi:hypothetical protein